MLCPKLGDVAWGRHYAREELERGGADLELNRTSTPAGGGVDIAATVLDELIYLRKGAGVTPARLERLDAVVRLLRGADERGLKTRQVFPVLVERLRSAIESLSLLDGQPSDDAQLLLDVFGLSPEAGDETQLGPRRDVAGAKLGIKRDAVADREATALLRLRSQLLTGWYPLSPLPLPTATPHGGAVLIAVRNRVVLQDWYLVENVHQFQLLATYDQAEYFEVNSTATEPIAVLGDEWRLEEEALPRGRRLRFYASTPMRRGQVYTLAYRVAPERLGEGAEVMVGNWQAFHEPTRAAVYEAEFRGARPTWVWWFSGLTHLAVPGKLSRQTLLTPDDAGRLGVRFTDLGGGLCAGLAWE